MCCSHHHIINGVFLHKKNGNKNLMVVLILLLHKLHNYQTFGVTFHLVDVVWSYSIPGHLVGVIRWAVT